METYPEQFPTDQRPDPNHRAENRAFDPSQGSDRPGFVSHEGQPDPEGPHLDFIIWMPGGGRFGMQVKGGH